MECYLLGSGGMMPMPQRLLTSVAVKLNGKIVLFDAGEGAQLGWKKAGLGYRSLRIIAVSHLHADHCLGIPGLMMLRAQMDNPDPLIIVGPPGIKDFVESVVRLVAFHLNYPVQFVEWSENAGDTAFQDEDLRIVWRPLKHTRFCLGFRLEERERPGRFDPLKAKAEKIPQGPLWGRLQKGQTVTLADGRQIHPEKVLGPPRRGRRMAYVVDTRPIQSIYDLAHEVDLAFLEGMFLQQHSHHAREKGHMTVSDGARIGKRSGAGQVVLVHISPRYGQDDLAQLDDEAGSRFPMARMGRDQDVFFLKLPD